MKTRIALIYFLLVFIFQLGAQSPQGFNYQAVARDATGDIIADDFVSLRFWILEDGQFGTPVYRETHENVYTGIQGIFTLKIGMGVADSGDFSNLDWANHEYYIRVDLDPSGGANFEQMGVSQLLTVPYAMYAQSSGDGGGSDDWGNQVVQSDNTLAGTGTNTDPLRVNVGQVNTDNQMLSINGNQLSITNGNSVNIPTGGTDADADPQNELQTINSTKNGAIITVDLNQGGNSPVVHSNTSFNIEDGDASSTNELQNLSSQQQGASNITLGITNGSGTTFSIKDLDADPNNEIQTLYLTGNVLNISGAQSPVTLPSGSLFWQPLSPTGIYFLDEVSIGGTSAFEMLTVLGSGYFHDGGVGSSYISLEGIIDLYGSSSSTQTVFLGDYDRGMLDLHRNGDHFVYLEADLAGYIETAGPFSLNGAFDWLFGYPDHGYISVYDDNGFDPAGMTVAPNGNGEIWADVKYFRMDHPGRSDQEIWYASLEGPEAAAYERGTTQLVDGEAYVEFTDHFSIVISENDLTVMLTPLSAESQGLAVIEKSAAGFRVKELYRGTGNYEFDWEVKSKRKGFEDYKAIRPKGIIKGAKSTQLHIDSKSAKRICNHRK